MHHVFGGYFSSIRPLPENITIILFINIFFSPERKREKFHSVPRRCAIVSRFFNAIAIGLRIYFNWEEINASEPNILCFSSYSGLALKVLQNPERAYLWDLVLESIRRTNLYLVCDLWLRKLFDLEHFILLPTKAILFISKAARRWIVLG